VANIGGARGDVSAYLTGSSRLVHATSNGVDSPDSIAVDGRTGEVYVASLIGNKVTVFAPGARTIERTITAGISYPIAMGFEKLGGSLFVLNNTNSTVSVYAPGASTPTRIIRAGIHFPTAMAFGDSGTLFVANTKGPKPALNTVTEYAPGANWPKETINLHIDNPSALAIDPQDNLYVADLGTGPDAPLRTGSVTVYAPGKDRPFLQFDAGVDRPRALLFNGDHLFIANLHGNDGKGSVANYAWRYGRLLNLVRMGIDHPNALAMDRLDNLYVANTNGNSITVYKAASQAMLRSITTGVNAPLALAISP